MESSGSDDAEMRRWIDEATYTELLRKLRFSPIGDPYFQGEMGDYFLARMRAMREEPGGDEAHVMASKAIGW